MSYPSGTPGGYPHQPPQQGAPVFGQPPAPPNPLGKLGIPGLLSLAVLVLALVSYFCSFGGGSGLEVDLLLAGGLLAAIDVLPKAPRVMPFAAVLSVVGGLGVLAAVINGGGGPIPASMWLILAFGLVQALAAVASLLIGYEIIKLAPKAAVPHSAPYPQTGGNYAPQQGQGGPGGHQPPPGAHQQTQYVNPAGAQKPPPQSTQFLQHPGQLNQRDSE